MLWRPCLSVLIAASAALFPIVSHNKCCPLWRRREVHIVPVTEVSLHFMGSRFSCLFFVHRAFEEVQVFWRVTLNQTATILQEKGLNLTDELRSVAGVTTCTVGQTQCFIHLELNPKKVSAVSR